VKILMRLSLYNMLMGSLFLSLHGETQSVPNAIVRIDNSMPFPTQVPQLAVLSLFIVKDRGRTKWPTCSCVVSHSSANANIMHAHAHPSKINQKSKESVSSKRSSVIGRGRLQLLLPVPGLEIK